MDGFLADAEIRLRELTGSLGHLFARPEPREVFHTLVEGMLSNLERKNGWTLAQRAGHTHPGRVQTFLCRGAWSAEALEAEVRRYVVDHLGDPDGFLIIDDTQIVKRGRRSVGVAPQHCGLTNQTENCQVAVLLTYAGVEGHAVIGHRLYLPRSWTDDPARCRAAGVPGTAGFATKLDLATGLLAEALDAGVPFGWVAMDGGYGQYTQVRTWCSARRLSYVAAVTSTLPLRQTGTVSGQAPVTCPKDILATLGEADFETRSCGAGARGQRYYDWAFIGLDAHLTVADESPAAGFAHTLLIRRSTSRPDQVRYFLAHAPEHTPMPVLVSGAGARWQIEEDNRIEKDLIGLDHYQVRTWTSWHHNIVVCMLAHAFLAVEQAYLTHHHPGDEDPNRGKADRPHHPCTPTTPGTPPTC